MVVFPLWRGPCSNTTLKWRKPSASAGWICLSTSGFSCATRISHTPQRYNPTGLNATILQVLTLQFYRL